MKNCKIPTFCLCACIALQTVKTECSEKVPNAHSLDLILNEHDEDINKLNLNKLFETSSPATEPNVFSFSNVNTYTKYKNLCNTFSERSKTPVTIKCHMCDVKKKGQLGKAYFNIIDHVETKHKICGGKHRTSQEASECEDCKPNLVTSNDEKLLEIPFEYCSIDDKIYLSFNFEYLINQQQYRNLYTNLPEKTKTLAIIACNLCSTKCTGILSATYRNILKHRVKIHGICKCNTQHLTPDHAQACVCLQKKIKPVEKSFWFSDITPKNYEKVYQKLSQGSMTKVKIKCYHCDKKRTGPFASVYIKMSEHTKMEHCICRCDMQHETSHEAFECPNCKPKPRKKRLSLKLQTSSKKPKN